MAAQKGKDLLLKVDSDGGGTFTTVAGLRSRAIAFNAEAVDVTHAESRRAVARAAGGRGRQVGARHRRRHLQGCGVR